VNAQDATNEAPLIPSEHVEELVQAIKDATLTPTFTLKIDPAGTPTLTSTKLGGIPYWPIHGSDAYPTTSKGQKLMLLAQLWLEDFDGCDRLPDHGLLQFFVDSDDDCSGMDFDDGTNQNGFRVVWHEEIDLQITAEDVRALDIPTSFDSWDDCLGNPLRGEYALSINNTQTFMNPSDESFSEVFLTCCKKLWGDTYVQGRDDWYDCVARPEADRIYELLFTKGPLHQVLGYPYFTQYDPRYKESLKDCDTLLLQVDSDSGPEGDRILWGDVGIGGFFINSDALRRGDFSRVLFNWDCY